MPLKIIRNDITKVRADTIVNSANPKPVYGSGCDSAVYEAAGVEELLAERRKIGVMERGSAAATPAFALDAKYIIHTVGPFWKDGRSGEFETLEKCYRNSLMLAAELGCGSVAFPLIATGVYGFPKDKAIGIAVSVISAFLLENDMTVTLVVFDPKSFELSGKLFSGIREYISDREAKNRLSAEYSFRGTAGAARRQRADIRVKYGMAAHSAMEEGIAEEASLYSAAEADAALCGAPAALYSSAGKKKRSLEDVVSQVGETFQERLLRLIDERGMTEVETYTKANLDRKLFYKIRHNPDYQPKKKTALAFAVALQLNLDETKDLISRAGYALSPSSRFDLVMEYFIENGEYDIYEINLVLFDMDLPLLGY